MSCTKCGLTLCIPCHEKQEAKEMEAWIGDLEDKEQLKACQVDDEDCVGCGS